MKIGLDFDKTIFPHHVEMWEKIVQIFKDYGHEVVIVTFRGGSIDDIKNKEVWEFSHRNGIPVIFTNGMQKSEAFKADLWIDDMPILIPSIGALQIATLGLPAEQRWWKDVSN